MKRFTTYYDYSKDALVQSRNALYYAKKGTQTLNEFFFKFKITNKYTTPDERYCAIDAVYENKNKRYIIEHKERNTDYSKDGWMLEMKKYNSMCRFANIEDAEKIYTNRYKDLLLIWNLEHIDFESLGINQKICPNSTENFKYSLGKSCIILPHNFATIVDLKNTKIIQKQSLIY